jgi:hypothetical protein
LSAGDALNFCHGMRILPHNLGGDEV